MRPGEGRRGMLLDMCPCDIFFEAMNHNLKPLLIVESDSNSLRAASNADACVSGRGRGAESRRALGEIRGTVGGTF